MQVFSIIHSVMSLKSIIKHVIPANIKYKLKRQKRKLKNALRFDAKATTLDDLNRVLTEQLGLKKGDRILVTSSFANLKAKDYSPQDVVKLLMEIVGEEGLIMMPYYPPINSMEWVKSEQIFDMRITRSGMGVLTNVFSKMEGVVMSEHPFKAVCVWGKNAASLAAGHRDCKIPYSKESPYGKVLSVPGSKSLCLGVVNLPMFHAIEDEVQPLDTLYYDDHEYDVPLILKNGEHAICHTLVHSSEKINGIVTPGTYAIHYKNPIRKKVKFGYDYIYLLDNDLMRNEFYSEFTQGKSRRNP